MNFRMHTVREKLRSSQCGAVTTDSNGAVATDSSGAVATDSQ